MKKRVLAVLMAAALALCLLPTVALAAGPDGATACTDADTAWGTFNGSDACVGKDGTAHAGQLHICAQNFPDANFLTYINNTLTGAADGYFTAAEAAAVTSINVYTKSIASVKGVEYFTALRFLCCAKNSLTALDVSKNTALTTLDCSRNQLTTLDLSKNTALTQLECYSNQLTALDVSQNTALTTLWGGSNQLTALDVSQNTALTSLRCEENRLTTLDVSLNTALTDFRCDGNQLTALDVSQNTALKYFYCGSNQLTALDVSLNTALTWLRCEENRLTALDLSKNTALTSLDCSFTALTALDLSKNTALTGLYYDHTKIAALDLSGFSGLENVGATHISGALDYSKLKQLSISGSRTAEDKVRLRIKVYGYGINYFSQDTSTGYISITGSQYADLPAYFYDVPSSEASGGMASQWWTGQPLPDGGLIDTEGNLIPGAAGTAYTVGADGAITVPAGGAIVTATGKFTFADGATLKDGVIRTNGAVNVATNTASGTTVTAEVSTVTITPSAGEGVSLTTFDDRWYIPVGSLVEPVGAAAWTTENIGSVDMVTGEVTDAAEPVLPTVEPTPAGPDITAPAADTTVRVPLGGKAELQITAPEATGFQWQVLRGNKWLNVAGAYGASYTAAPATAEDDGLQYRCIAYLSGGRSDSPVFTLEVDGVAAAAEPNPETGANDFVALAAGLALAALCAAGCVLTRKKK